MIDTPETNSPATDRFETIVNFAISNFVKANNIEAPTEDLRAEILQAADQLLEDAAMEMADSTMNGIFHILLQIYRHGQTPGVSPNPMLNQLQNILAQAGREANAADHSAQDTY